MRPVRHVVLLADAVNDCRIEASRRKFSKKERAHLRALEAALAHVLEEVRIKQREECLSRRPWSKPPNLLGEYAPMLRLLSDADSVFLSGTDIGLVPKYTWKARRLFSYLDFALRLRRDGLKIGRALEFEQNGDAALAWRIAAEIKFLRLLLQSPLCVVGFPAASERARARVAEFIEHVQRASMVESAP